MGSETLTAGLATGMKAGIKAHYFRLDALA